VQNNQAQWQGYGYLREPQAQANTGVKRICWPNGAAVELVFTPGGFYKNEIFFGGVK
jgi:hypothetical protein